MNLARRTIQAQEVAKANEFQYCAQYRFIIRQMREQTRDLASTLDHSQRIVFNVEDLPPFLADNPQRRLKLAEKEGVKAAAWLIAELRHQGSDVFFSSISAVSAFGRR